MMDKLETQLRRGKRAQALFEDLLETYKDQIFNTNFADDDKRKSLWMAYNMLDKIKGHLQTVMEGGKIAQKDLELLNKR